MSASIVLSQALQGALLVVGDYAAHRERMTHSAVGDSENSPSRAKIVEILDSLLLAT